MLSKLSFLITRLRNSTKRICLGILPLIFSFIDLGAQNVSSNGVDLPNVIAPSPVAQTFMRYGEIPVDYSTGVPNIEIPIFTVEEKKLRVPISISYHASGIKVNDIASEVGLGWTLNCGGLVSRSINSQPDEKGSLRTYDNAAEFLAGLHSAADQGYNQATNCMDGLRNFENFYNWNFLNNEDLMKDRFFYRLPGGASGVFTYDFVSDDVILLPLRPIKIEKVLGQSGTLTLIESFKITDDNGTIYTFQSYIANPAVGITEWFVKEMVSADGTDTIKFNYVLQPANVPTPGIIQHHYQGPAQPETLNCHPFDPLSSMSQFLSPYPQFTTPVLESVISSSAVVRFEYAGRDDFDYLKRLTKITVSPAGESRIVKTVHFNPRYFGLTNENRRLGLDNVVVSSPNDPEPQTYRFTYESQVLPPYPFKMTYPTYSEDYWGYYNDNIGGSSSSLIPSDFISHTIDKQYYGGNREADATSNQYYARACLLKEIRYPTGGKTVFEFERCLKENLYPYKADPAKRHGYVGGFRVARVANYTDENTLANEKAYDYELPVARQVNWPFFRFRKTVIESGQSGTGYPCYTKFSREHLSGSPLLPIEVAPGMPVMYQKVTEYNGTRTNHAGKTVYTYGQPYCPSDYLNHPEHPIEFESPEFYHPYHYDRGNYVPEMQSKTVYSFDGTSYQLVHKEEYEYSKLFASTHNTGIKLTRTKQFPSIDYWCFECIGGAVACSTVIIELAAEYKASAVALDTKSYQEASLLTNHKVYRFDPINPNQYEWASTTYVYNGDNLAVTDVVTTSSKQHALRTVYKYPHDFGAVEPYKTMVTKNNVRPVIEQVDYNDTELQLIRRIRTNYKNWGNEVIEPELIQVQNGTQGFLESRITYHSYDSRGNITEVSRTDDSPKTYIWGYNGVYPVAETVGSDYATVTSFVNLDMLKDAAQYSDQQIRNELDKIRLGLFSFGRPFSITTYTYDPLVGMTSKTDSNGKTTYYEYSNGRLIAIRDHEFNIVKAYDYHYRK